MANLTMIGLYNYDTSIFDNLYIPSGIERSDIINAILLRCGECEVLYPNASFLRSIMGVFTHNRKYHIDGFLKSTQFVYNPIENYDRNEEITDAESNIATSTSSGTSTGKVAGFDSEKLLTNTGADSQTSGNANGSRNYSRKSHVHGNVGVTTTQEMLLSEREVVKFSFYEEYANLIAENFCLLIY